MAHLHGIGCDITSIQRFSSILTQPPAFITRFSSKILHPIELAHFTALPLASPLRPQFLASRWSVKESVIKALGRRVLFPEISLDRTENASDPRPKLQFHGECRKIVDSLGIVHSHVSLSHESDFAIAYVILERNPNEKPAALTAQTKTIE